MFVLFIGNLAIKLNYTTIKIKQEMLSKQPKI
ncbi:MAG: Unknown protein [uncultured Sulfurovum sp.]|uniref:Uncharacterized protein n=1 Tax=uncultured Sulfurovum sp. TaxID=269237 RepID=A0A6S6TIV4_9BACT|nr:MAG: Unknown protein [uncultured Sulfurovum sp.]